MFFSPTRNDPEKKKTHTHINKMFATHPVSGQSRKFLYVYVCFLSLLSEKAFVSQRRVSGFPEKRETSGEVRETSGEVRETSGEVAENFQGTSGLLFSSTGRELPGKSPKTSGEVRGTSGEVRGLLLRSSGELDSLPATRQICLQLLRNPEV